MRGVEVEVPESRKTQSSVVRRGRLFLGVGVAGDGVLDGLSSVADGLLGGGEDALALVGGLVAA